MQAFKKLCTTAIILVLGSTCRSWGAPQTTPHGMALLYGTRGVSNVSLVQAVVNLPQQKSNRSWYASWLMTLPVGDRNTEPFLQIGLLRQAESGDNIWPFVAYRHQGGKLVFQSFTPRHGSKAALIQIDSRGSRITLRIDGRALFQTPKAAFFNVEQSGHLYFQLGDEVSAYGDHVSGEISNIQVRRPTGIWPYVPSCTYADYGLSIIGNDDQWQGRGVFTAGPGAFHDTWNNSVVQRCG